MSTNHFMMSAAIHESGHSLIGEFFSMRVTEISVEPNGAGLCKFDRAPRITHDSLTMSYAGDEAVREFGYTPTGGARDRTQEQYAAERRGWAAGDDDMPRLNARCKARELVQRFKPAIEVLAKRLYNRRRIDGREVRDILADHRAGRLR